MIDRVVFSLIQAACSGERRRFLKNAAGAVASVQAGLLRGYLRKAAGTELGAALDFGRIRAAGDDEALYRAYAETVPVAGYDRIEPLVKRVMEGERRLFTRDRIRLLEPTSGSSGGTKLIPYTDGLRREYLRGIRPWIHSLLSHVPEVRRGSWYWSISPAGQHQDASSAVPVGFQDDAAYAGPLAGLFRRLFPVPPWIKAVADLRNFRHVTCLCLLASHDLSMISVWSPSYLTLLLEDISAGYPQLLGDLATGRFTLPVANRHDRDLCAGRRVRVKPTRLRFLRSLSDLRHGVRAVDLWPHLAVVSCWTDGPSAAEVPRLRELAGPVAIRKKGLLATEGIFTIPLDEAGGCVPAYRSHYLEFRPVPAQEARPCPGLQPAVRVHELEIRRSYELIVTTGGGLYRYAMGDRVRVAGTWKGLPVLEFEGRIGTSDLVGEKIGQEDAERTLGACDAVFVSPVRPDTGQPYYAVFMPPGQRPSGATQRLAEAALRKNFHYAHARDLGQLAPARVYWLPGPLAELRQSAAGERGVGPGDVKPATLGPNAADGRQLCRRSVRT